MAFEIYTIQSQDAVITIVPDRGGLISGFSYQGKEILYLDPATLTNTEVSIRGGIPLLFPNAGFLQNNLFIEKGTTIPRHGFARNTKWIITDQQKSELTMEPIITEEFKKGFPYDFSLKQRVVIHNGLLEIHLLITNNEKVNLPLAPGFHPYFNVKKEDKTGITCTPIAEYIPRLSNEQFDLSLPMPDECILQTPEYTITLRACSAYKKLQFWTLIDKDFICLEPWVGENDDLNIKDHRISIEPRETKDLWFSIEIIK